MPEDFLCVQRELCEYFENPVSVICLLFLSIHQNTLFPCALYKSALTIQDTPGV